MRWLFGRLIPAAISEQVFADYVRCFSDPGHVYTRCARTIAQRRTSEHERADIASKVRCVLALIGARTVHFEKYSSDA